MEREYFVVTSNSYFYLGFSALIKDSSESEVHLFSLDSYVKIGGYNESDLFVVYFDDMMSNFKALLFFESLNNDVMFISKNSNVKKLCSKFGFKSVKMKSVMDTNVMFRGVEEKIKNRKLLSNMELHVITRLLDGESNIKLARKTRLSDKTISHHKRSALFKVGVRDINLFFDNISKDIFHII